MNNYGRRQLRYFVAVAEDLHFGRAAQRLRLSQPSLSQQIAALENDLGLKLLLRTKRKVELTAAGQQFLQDARKILTEMMGAATRAQAADKGQTGVLRIGLNYSAPFHPLPTEIFMRFAANFPHVKLELHQDTSAKQLDQLHRQALDLCFVWPTRDDVSKDIIFKPLDKDEIRFVTSQKHALANKTRLLASDLRSQILFLMPWQTRTDFYNALLTACRKEGFEPELRTDIIQMPFVMSVVAANQGVTFVPAFLEKIRPRGTVLRKFNYLPQAARLMPLCLAYRAKDASPLIKNFLLIVNAIR
jgi:DNA-binding transcriptional LysR family regulator